MSKRSSSTNGTSDTKNGFGSGFIFVGGGTGGHLYPALAIIERLEEINHNSQTQIVCSERWIDRDILSAAGAAFSTIPAVSPSGGLKGFFRFATRWGPSVRSIRGVISQMKESCDQVTVVAMGGFVSAPSAMAARSEGVGLVLVNLDAVPGKANRWIAKHASHSLTAAPVDGFGDWIKVRPIVRGFGGQQDRAGAMAEFGLDPEKKTLLVTGGSQGARSINQLMIQHAGRYSSDYEGWQVLHQVGAGGGDGVAEGYCEAGIGAVVVEYIEEMGGALCIADLAIGRCGAGTVAECWAACVPSIFWPYPYHKDEHQRHNAGVLVEAGCAVICTDFIDPERNLLAHAQVISRGLTDGACRDQMRECYEALGDPDGAGVIAEFLVQ